MARISRPEGPENLGVIQERRPYHPPSEAPTYMSYMSSFGYGCQEEQVFLDDAGALDEWLKTLPPGDSMKVQQRIAVRNIEKSVQEAIRHISTSPGTCDHETWTLGARWQQQFAKGDYNYQPYLSIFGYDLSEGQHWQSIPKTPHPQLDLQVDGHISKAGHTWYNVKCKISGMQNGCGADTIEWVSPRRLVQLRLDLHHNVRHELRDVYDQHFHQTRFAKLGGPPGTTARLRDWLGTLASCINQGIAQPCVATLVLAFFHAPVPEGTAVPAGQAGVRQGSSGDNHSNLGDIGVQIDSEQSCPAEPFKLGQYLGAS